MEVTRAMPPLRFPEPDHASARARSPQVYAEQPGEQRKT
jgi:hypothetical protein